LNFKNDHFSFDTFQTGDRARAQTKQKQILKNMTSMQKTTEEQQEQKKPKQE
jgi:hypothetical protein